MAYVVRRCTAEDAAQVAAVARRTWHATYAEIIPEAVRNAFLDQHYNHDLIARQAASGRMVFLVAADDAGAIVGYGKAAHRKEPGDAELLAIYALPEHQGRGAGGQLLAAVLLSLAASRPVERLYVQVERDNAVGRLVLHTAASAPAGAKADVSSEMGPDLVPRAFLGGLLDDITCHNRFPGRPWSACGGRSVYNCTLGSPRAGALRPVLTQAVALAVPAVPVRGP